MALVRQGMSREEVSGTMGPPQYVLYLTSSFALLGL
jgi:hypothetical protein